MINFIATYWVSIVVVIAIIGAVIFLCKNGMKKQAFQILFYLVTQAESQFGNGTGELKFATVVTWLYEKMPVSFRFLFTESQISNLIETAVTRMKEYLAKNIEAQKVIKAGATTETK